MILSRILWNSFLTESLSRRVCLSLSRVIWSLWRVCLPGSYSSAQESPPYYFVEFAAPNSSVLKFLLAEFVPVCSCTLAQCGIMQFIALAGSVYLRRFEFVLRVPCSRRLFLVDSCY